MKKEKIRAAIYIRVSSREQALEGYSLDAQERTLTDFCKLKKYEVTEIYRDEGISAKDLKHRPDMLRLLADAKEKKFDIILVWKLTRFSRNMANLMSVCEELDKKEISLVSFSEAFDSTTPAGRMVRSMLGTVAQFEREVISENVMMGLLERARQGKRTCNEVLGYNIEGKDSFTINEKEAEQVKFIFDNYLIYKNISQVAELCRERRFRGKRGGIPKAQSILLILTNAIYCGFNPFKGEFHKGNFKPIVSVEQFNNVQNLLRRQGKITGRKRKIELINL